MGSRLRISVIVPTRNEARYIERTLAAIVAQTYPCHELIVVDTQSEDGTDVMAERMGARVVREPRGGVPFAREAGRLAAVGEVLTFIDADTIIPPNYLARIAAFFAEHPQHAAVSNLLRFYEGSRGLRAGLQLFFWVIFPPYNWLLQRLGRGNLIGGNFSIRRDAAEQMGGFISPYLFYGEDAVTSRRLSAAGLSAGFLNDLYTETSARRFNQMGAVALAKIYVLHHFRIMFGKAPPKSH